MKKTGNFALRLAVILLTFRLAGAGSMAQNQNGAAADKPQDSRRFRVEPLKFSDLTGYAVENENAEQLGSVKDLVIDTRSGRLDYVIVSMGGFAGIGAKLKAVPATAVSPATTLEKTLALNISHDRWEKAPVFSKGQLATLGYPRQARRLNQYYNQPWPGPAQTAEPKSSLTPTGRAARKAGGLYLANELSGKGVVNAQGQNLGNIADLLVELRKPDVTFALLEPGAFITWTNEAAKGALYAIPLSAFIPDAKDKNLVANLTPDDFQQAGPMNADSWTAAPGGSSPRIFRYPTDGREHATDPESAHAEGQHQNASKNKGQ